MSKLKKNFRKRALDDEGDESELAKNSDDEEEEERRLALEEVKFLQKQRCKKSGMPALPAPQSGAASGGVGGVGVGNGSSEGGLVQKRVKDKNEGEGEKEELVLQDTFAQETAVLEEDPNMLRYVEQELAKKRGKNIDDENKSENDIKHAEDELYKIPEHLKVKKRNSEESSTQWTTGIAEIQLPIEFKLRNIEETEAAKKLLQEKRLVGRPKSESNMPSSYSADYFQRGRDYAEKLRREHPELYKERTTTTATTDDNKTSEPDAPAKDGAVQRRAAATDEFMLDKFRKRERHRMRR